MSTLNTNFHFLFKYIIIGDSYVGKSNLLLRYVHGEFKDEYQLTIGVEFGSKNIEIKDKIYRIQIWDTAGQENFRSITRAYYKNSVCALIVYDITNRESFHNIQTWIEDCREQAPETINMILIGNKCDLEDKRVVTFEEGKQLAQKNQMLFFETSAKTGAGVEDVFLTTADKIVENIEGNIYDLTSEDCGIKQGMISTNFSLEENIEPTRQKCC